MAGRMSALDENQRCHIAETLMLPSEGWEGEEWVSAMSKEFDSCAIAACSGHSL
jgi:hypothetical protein